MGTSKPDYKDIFGRISRLHHAIDQLEDRPQQGASRDVGHEGCSEEEVLDLEHRLDVRLPDSYRLFLLEINGCDRLGLSHGGLLRADQVKWFRDENQDWIDAYLNSEGDDVAVQDHLVYGPKQLPYLFRRAFLPALLQIGNVFDGAVYLLNPCVKEEESGEWEAWDFATWYAGTYRRPSFLALAENTAETLEEQLMHIKNRDTPTR